MDAVIIDVTRQKNGSGVIRLLPDDDRVGVVTFLIRKVPKGIEAAAGCRVWGSHGYFVLGDRVWLQPAEPRHMSHDGLVLELVPPGDGRNLHKHWDKVV